MLIFCKIIWKLTELLITWMSIPVQQFFSHQRVWTLQYRKFDLKKKPRVWGKQKVLLTYRMSTAGFKLHKNTCSFDKNNKRYGWRKGRFDLHKEGFELYKTKVDLNNKQSEFTNRMTNLTSPPQGWLHAKLNLGILPEITKAFAYWFGTEEINKWISSEFNGIEEETYIEEEWRIYCPVDCAEKF
jgi:hypothetical protein